MVVSLMAGRSDVIPSVRGRVPRVLWAYDGGSDDDVGLLHDIDVVLAGELPEVYAALHTGGAPVSMVRRSCVFVCGCVYVCGGVCGGVSRPYRRWWMTYCVVVVACGSGSYCHCV